MNPLYALAAAAAKDPPIIDLDSTVLVQLAIFVVTALVLSRTLFRPYLAVKAARGAGIEGARDEARRMEEEAAAKVAGYDQAFAQARSRAGAERTKLQSEAVGRERQILDAARTSTGAALEQARKKLAADAAAARAQLEPRAQEIARAIARKILGREVA
jgi:F0F1-type ATP synthase membrane subunit b/b'